MTTPENKSKPVHGGHAHPSAAGPEPMLQFFKYDHLPPHLQAASKPFCDLAAAIAMGPRNPERTVALRKLLESKDAAVRSHVYVEVRA